MTNQILQQGIGTTGAVEPQGKARERELLKLRARIRALGRLTAADVFKLGGCLVEAKAILPAASFGPWVRSACGFSTSTGLSYVAVYQRLAAYRDRLERVRVTPAVLFIVAYAEEPQIEQVVAGLEAGQVLTASQTRRITGVTARRKADVDAAPSAEELERRRLAEEQLVTMLNRAFGGLFGSGERPTKAPVKRPARRRVTVKR